MDVGTIKNKHSDLFKSVGCLDTSNKTDIMLWKMANSSSLASLSSTFRSACCLTLVSSSVLSAFVKILVKHLVSGVLFARALTAPQTLGADARF